MRVSEAGLAFIKRWEGCELNAYCDVAGVWTIGWGHTAGFRNGRFAPDSTITEGEAEALLIDDLKPREANLVLWAQTHDVTLNQNEFDALTSFIFNVGFAAFEKSTTAKRLKKDDWQGAAEALTWWNRATLGDQKVEVLGLTRRRAAEKELFLTPPKESVDE